ncbi:MAG: shikimate kinase [Bacteroidales bacterium]
MATSIKTSGLKVKIYLVGISCVGKTTIGRLLADYLGFTFYDLDDEVQKYYQKPIEIIQNECLSMNGYRQKASVVLDKLLKIQENSVISGTPAGLRDSYLQVYKKHKKEINLISVNIIDTPENVLDRLTFYDIDSKLLDIELIANEKKKYLKKIIVDLNYFKKSLSRADLQISIENMSLTEIPELISNQLKNSIIK